MKRSKFSYTQKGFTLIEMVIVITIIGVLAALIVPSVLNYVKKANRAADKVTARMIGSSVVAAMAENPDFYDSFYAADTMKFYVTIDGQSYYYANIARADGSKNCYGSDPTENKDKNKKFGAGWEFTSYKNANKAVTEKLNERISDIVGGNAETMSFIPMRSTGYKHPIEDCNHDRQTKSTNYSNSNKVGNERNSSKTYSYTDKWLIGYNAGPDGKEKGAVEVWAGDSYGKGTNGPRVRLWPAPPSYY